MHEIAPAIGADAVQDMGDAVGAKRALIGADACIHAVGRQVAVAAFAVGAEFEHVDGYIGNARKIAHANLSRSRERSTNRAAILG